MAVIGRDQFQRSAAAASRAGDWLRSLAPKPRRRRSGNLRLVRLVELALAILLGVIIARVVLSLLAPLPAPEAPPPVLPAAAEGGEVRGHPFRLMASAAPPASESAAQAADTSLNLELHGAWIEPDGRSSAIIRMPDGEQKAFSLGDPICCGATLEAVEADQVIILRNGVREALRLPSRRNSAQAPQRPSPPRAAAPAQLQFTDLVRIQPIRDAAGLTRVAVFPATDEASFEALGLKEGDIVVAIGDKEAPSDLGALSQLLTGLRGAAKVELTVERNGVRLPVEVRLKTPSASGDEEG